MENSLQSLSKENLIEVINLMLQKEPTLKELLTKKVDQLSGVDTAQVNKVKANKKKQHDSDVNFDISK